jgi:hypothetical protein
MRLLTILGLVLVSGCIHATAPPRVTEHVWVFEPVDATHVKLSIGLTSHAAVPMKINMGLVTDTLLFDSTWVRGVPHQETAENRSDARILLAHLAPGETQIVNVTVTYEKALPNTSIFEYSSDIIASGDDGTTETRFYTLPCYGFHGNEVPNPAHGGTCESVRNAS